MRIVHISQQDDDSGAFKAAYRLHCALNQTGHDSHMVVLSKLTNDSKVHPLVRPNLLAKVVWRILDKMNNRHINSYPAAPLCGWTGSRFSIGGLRAIERLKPDIIQLHIFDCVLTYQEISQLPGSVFWTFHDMSPITGGCHCTPDCLRYLNRCGFCPELGSEIEEDASRAGWKSKRVAWQHPNLTAIAPSRWLEKEARASPMCAGHQVTRIPNGVPLNIFNPERRQAARCKLGFHDDRLYLLAGSAALGNELKGFNFVVEAAQQLAITHPGRIELVTFGRGAPTIANLPPRHYGYLKDDVEMAELYAACDLYILPTQVDNLPNVLLESIACGTPCVTFDVGGCPDVVRDGVTGFVVKERSSNALIKAIEALAGLSTQEYGTLRLSCRAVAEAEYGLEHMAQAYLSLYQQHL